MNHNILRIIFILFLSYCINPPGKSQTEMPDVLQKGNLTEQLNYIEERTRIYDYYRAIREDMWQQIKKNTLDTLSVARGEISTLAMSHNKYNTRIDSLNKLITDASVKLDEALRTKNNINVLGLNVNKFAYNSVMWIIVAVLAAILAIGFLAFKRNIAVTRNTKKDLEELKTEFEAYRKQSREAREKMSMEHFNELRRLRTRGEEHRAGSGGQRAEDKEQRANGEEHRAQSGERGAQSGASRAESRGKRAEGSELKAHVSSGASPASGVITKKAAKEVAKEEGSVLKAESLSPIEKNELARVPDSELNVSEKIPMDQASPGSQSLGDEAGLQEIVPTIKNEPRKLRKKRTKSPDQGSIEL